MAYLKKGKWKSRHIPKRKPFQDRKPEDDTWKNRTLWRKTSKVWLSENPYCENCRDKGRLVPATSTDHMVPTLQGGAKYDPDNFMSLCQRRFGGHGCHDQKSGKERHKPILIKTKENEHGELIPKDRNDIFEHLK